jgi:hypothetical protein
MKKISMLLMTILVIFFVSCKQQSKHAKDMNPFLMQYNTPFNVPPIRTWQQNLNASQFPVFLPIGRKIYFGRMM